MKKNIIITGSESGIGLATCKLLEKHYDIIRIDKKINVELAKDYACNTIHEIVKTIGKPKVYAIINCAGINFKKSFYEYSEEEWNYTVNTNIRSIWILSKLFLSQLKKSQGHIINISSIHSQSTLKDNSVYSMSKGAIESFTKGLAVELAPYNIKVNCIRLGSIDTPMLKKTDGLEQSIPIGYIAQPIEVSRLIQFILGNNTQYMTGSIINLDGGILSKTSVIA